MPILYHPTASYQFYIAPDSSSVNITAAIFNVGGVTLDVETKAQSTTTNTLVEGTSGPDTWTQFNINTEPAQGNTAANPQLYYLYPARFISPIVDEFTGSEEIRVLTHPYGGALTGGTELNGVAKVEFYLNNGPAVLGTKTTDINTGQENIWSVKMPSSISANMTEVRAKVFPKVGRVNILQGTGYKTETEVLSLYGDKRSGDGTPRPYVAGIYPNRRGCLREKGLTTYYIAATGSNSNNGTSSGTAVKTPQYVYENLAPNDTNIKIINGYTAAANALPAADFVKNKAGVSHTSHLPVIEGGVMIWNDGVYRFGNHIGCIFKNVDFRINTNIAQGAVNITSNAPARYVFINCDIGPDAKSDSHGGQFGELEDQFTNGFIGGLQFEIKQTTAGSPTFFHGCDFRYATASTSKECVDSVFVLPPTQNDVCNAQLLYNVKMLDIGPLLYPYGSVGNASMITFCPKGSAKGYTATVQTSGVTLGDARTKLDTFYYTLGTSAGISGSPNVGVTLTGAVRDGKAEWKVINPNSSMITAFEALSNSGLSGGFWPDYIFSLRKQDKPWNRKAIDVGYFIGITSATNPTQYAGGTAYRGWTGAVRWARDPHFDLVQMFYESDFGGTAEDGASWNTILNEVYVKGYYNDYQGLFFTDSTRCDGLAIWNIDLQRDSSQPSAIFFTGGDHQGNNKYLHVGPYVQNTFGRFTTRFSDTSNTPAPMQDIFFYETDNWTFPTTSLDPSGIRSKVYDWETAPISYLSRVGISGSINSWLVTDNPYTLNRYVVTSFFQNGGTLDGSVDGGGIRFITPGLCGDLSGPQGFLGANFQNNEPLTYSISGMGSNQTRFGVTGQHSDGVITDPVSGVTYQSWDPDTESNPDKTQMNNTYQWLSANDWRILAGLTFNVGSTFEKYFEWIIDDFVSPGVTWTGINTQNGYSFVSSATIRKSIRNTDPTFPQAYHAAASTSFSYNMVPMQITYYVEKKQ